MYCKIQRQSNVALFIFHFGRENSKQIHTRILNLHKLFIHLQIFKIMGRLHQRELNLTTD
jgi:hypothetical protein